MVLGPASDGGYYLIGLKRPHQHLFTQIAWGTQTVARSTCERAADIGLATTLLPETHIAVVPANRIVAGMEEAFALIRKECGMLPRAVNLISGPSRTGDIEQTIVLGAHGPYRVHILVLET